MLKSGDIIAKLVVAIIINQTICQTCGAVWNVESGGSQQITWLKNFPGSRRGLRDWCGGGAGAPGWVHSGGEEIAKNRLTHFLWKLLEITFWFQPGGRPGPLQGLPGGRHGPRHFQVLCLYTLGQETTFFLSGEFTATSSTRWHRPPFLTTAMTRFYAVRDSSRWAGNLLLENIAMEYFWPIFS